MFAVLCILKRVLSSVKTETLRCSDRATCTFSSRLKMQEQEYEVVKGKVRNCEDDGAKVRR